MMSRATLIVAMVAFALYVATMCLAVYEGSRMRDGVQIGNPPTGVEMEVSEGTVRAMERLSLYRLGAKVFGGIGAVAMLVYVTVRFAIGR